MKKFVCILALTIISLFATTSAKAIEGCGYDFYLTSEVWNIGGTIYGYSATELSYCAGLYNDPVVSGIFLENTNLIGQGYSEGYAHQYPAVVGYNYSSPAAGQTYTTFGDHYVIAYYLVYVPYWNDWFWYDPWQLGFLEAGGGYEAPGYYGFGYAYYWTSQYIYTGNTSDSMVYCGQTQCQAGQQFTSTGISCSFQFTGGVCEPQTPPTLRIKDKNGNYIENTTQNVMVGAPTFLTAELIPNDSNTTISWSFGNNSENEIDGGTKIAKVTWLEAGNYNATVIASKNGVSSPPVQVIINAALPSLDKIEGYESIPDVVGTECDIKLYLALGCYNKYYSEHNSQFAGAEITAEANPPQNHISSPNSNGPSLGFIQVVNPFIKWTGSILQNPYEDCRTKRASSSDTTVGWLLDGEIPYGGDIPVLTREAKTIADFSNGKAIARMVDFPGVELKSDIVNNQINSAFTNQEFETYPIYYFKTKNGTTVTKVLGKIGWLWQGNATFNLSTNMFDKSLLLPQTFLTPITFKGTVSSGVRSYEGVAQDLQSFPCSSNLNQFASNFVSKEIPLSFNTGEEFEGTLILKNTGSATWTQNNVALKVTFESDLFSPPISGGQGGPFLTYAPSQISTGQNATFLLFMNAPNAVGNYILKTQMVKMPENLPFGAITTHSINVTSAVSCNNSNQRLANCNGFFDPDTCNCDDGYGSIPY